MKNKEHAENIEQAFKLHQQGDLIQASNLYQKLLSETPDDAELHHLFSILLAQQNQLDEAIVYLEQAIHLNNKDARYYNSLGNILARMKKNSDAIKKYELALELNPNSADAHNNLANLLLKINKTDKALKHYAIAIQVRPDFVDAHFNLGLLFFRLNKLDYALKQFNNVMQLNPQHEKAIKNIADIYLQQEKIDLAIEYYQRLLAINAADIEALNNLAALYLQNNRYENAKNNYLKLLVLKSDDKEIYYNLAVAEMALGEVDDAIKHFNAVLQTDSQHIASLCNLGAIYMRLNQAEKAIAMFRHVLSFDSKNRIASYMLHALEGIQGSSEAPKEYVETLFDNYSTYYEKHVREVLHYNVPKLLREALCKVTAKRKFSILDLGCGTGLVGMEFHDFASKLVGVDISSKMLGVAAAKHIYDQLMEADITQLKNIKEKFDLIIAADVFVYLGDLQSVLQHCKKLLNINGYLVFTVEVLDKESFSYILQKSARFAHSKSYLTNLATLLNFKICLCDKIELRQQENKSVAGYLSIWQLCNFQVAH